MRLRRRDLLRGGLGVAGGALVGAPLFRTGSADAATADIPGTAAAADSLGSYPNVLNLHGVPKTALPAEVSTLNVFADQGAWHAYGLPAEGDTEQYGGFTGPLYMAQEYPWYLSTSFTRFGLMDAATGETVDLAADTPPKLTAWPGRLEQRYTRAGLLVELSLRFVSARSALVLASIRNTGGEAVRLTARWSGALLRAHEEPVRSAPSLHAGAHGPVVDFGEVRQNSDYLTSGAERFEVRHSGAVQCVVTGDAYTTRMLAPFDLAAGESREIAWVETYTFTPTERSAETRRVAEVLADPRSACAEVDARWRNYVTAAVRGVPEAHRTLAVKSVETLVTNWRSPAGMLASDGVTPSLTYKWFAGGFWAWDSWKTAVGTAVFDPKLAASTVDSVFDHQITAHDARRPQDAGMLPDGVFYNDQTQGGANWNERNSKPPLGAWATWRVYQRGHDTDWLRRMYPKLRAFQEWWYRNRDHDGNGIAEYGATVDPANDAPASILEAAAWESGMDDAPRFDADNGASTVPNRDARGRVTGYSLNQESVDLNSYLHVDKLYLARIARELGEHDAAHAYETAAEQIANYVRTHMWDDVTGFFYDIDATSKQPLVSRGRGIEGAIPLWAGIAERRQAAIVRDILRDPREFGSHVPFPCVARSSPFFDATGYWRGAVWFDQALFALDGLSHYGYVTEARELGQRLLHHADGLLTNTPVAENYNPNTGAPMNSTNFSWSAALLLDWSHRAALED